MIWLLIILINVTTTSKEELKALHNNAIDSYNDEAYEAALGYWQAIEEVDKQSAQLYFNLGNAHYKTGSIGKSIYYYEKALKLKPNYQYAKDNIEFISNQIANPIEEQPGNFSKRTWKNVAFKLTTNQWAILFLLSLWFFILAIMMLLIRKQPWIKRAAFIATFVLLFVAIFSGVFAFSRYHFDLRKGFAIILNENTSVKNTAQPASKEKYTVSEGLKVEIVQKDNEWYLVQIPDGREGWVSKDDIGVI